jgi:hypothetical protein
VKLEADRVRGERVAGKTGPSDRALALLDPLFARAALVVEGDDIFGRPRQVGDDEANTRIQFARMPFDLGDDTAWLCPTSSLIGEVRVGAPDVKGGAAERTLEKIADAFLQDAVGGQPDGVFDPFAFEVLIVLGIGEPGVGRLARLRNTQGVDSFSTPAIHAKKRKRP